MTENNTTGPRSKPDELPGSFPTAESPDTEHAADDGCDYAARVSAYHDGEVSESEARDLSRHLAGCQACAAQLAFFGRVSRTFEGAPVRRLDAEARKRLEGLGGQLPNNEAERPVLSGVEGLRIKPSADVRWVRRLSAAAAILFVVAAGKVIYDQRLPGHDLPIVAPTTNEGGPASPAPQPVSIDGTAAPHPASPQKP